MAVVVALVVFLLLLAAVCGVIAIWTIVVDLRAGAPAPRLVQAPLRARALAPLTPRRPILVSSLLPRRLGLPPGVPLLPPPLSRRRVHASPTFLARDEEEDDDYTEVELDEGLTTVRDPRFALRR